jgi:SAM-dependent methyltransferase
MSDVDKWYRNYWARHQARTIAYQTIIAKCVSCEASVDLNEYEQIIFDHTKTAERLLDFGAGDKALKKKFLAAGFRGIYETLDISSEDTHEYSALDQVLEKFDAILCLEVIEHMTLNEYVDLMDGFGEILKPGGILVISTPNPLCVVPMWSGDPGHISQFPLADLTADFMVRGYKVQTWRVRYGAWPRRVFDRLRFFCMRVLTYLQSVDYAQGLLVIGKKFVADPLERSAYVGPSR